MLNKHIKIYTKIKFKFTTEKNDLSALNESLKV